MDWETEMDLSVYFNDEMKLRQAIALKTTGGFDSNDRLILMQLFLKMLEMEKCSLDLFKVFIEAGVDVNSRDSSGNTPLALCHRVDIAQFLLDSGADVNAVNKHNKGPLQMAIKRGRTAIAKLLIKHGARCQIGDLTCAAGWWEDVSLIEMLVNIGSDVNEYSLHGRTPLITSVRNLEPKIVQFLINSGADVNAIAKNKGQRTVLMEAVTPLQTHVSKLMKNHQYNRIKALLVSMLLKAGANVNGCDASGRTALMMCESTTIAELLIKNGANVNHTILDDNNRQLSVLSEMLSQSESMSQVLLRHGARVNEDDLVRLMSNSEFSASKAISLELFDQLLCFGVNVNARNKDGLTPLMLCRNRMLAEKLLEKGVDVNATCFIDSKEMSALSVAIEHKCMDVAVILSRHGAEAQPADLLKAVQYGFDDTTLACLISSCPRKNEFVNMRDADGKTPLMLCRTLESVRLLLELGADVNARISDESSTDNLTVLMDRVRGPHRSDVSIVRALLEARADVNAVSDSGSSAMSLLLSSLCTYDSDQVPKSLCLKLLVEHGAKFTKEYNDVLAKCIEYTDLDAIELLVTNGAPPVSLCPIRSANNSRIQVFQIRLQPILSPCCMALLFKDLLLARYFQEIDFLTPSDVTQMPKTLKTLNLGQEVNKIVDDMLHHPLSLFRLSFIAVSALVGPAPGRKERVQCLGIPPSLQRKLLFQDLSVRLIELIDPI